MNSPSPFPQEIVLQVADSHRVLQVRRGRAQRLPDHRVGGDWAAAAGRGEAWGRTATAHHVQRLPGAAGRPALVRRSIMERSVIVSLLPLMERPPTAASALTVPRASGTGSPVHGLVPGCILQGADGICRVSVSAAYRRPEAAPCRRESYRQFCPVAMASEVLATRWTLVLLRELHRPASARFNDLRRGVPRMSPSLLSKRLAELERAGKNRSSGDRSPARRGISRYQSSPEAGRDLEAVVMAVGTWGPEMGRDRNPASAKRRSTRAC